MRKRSYIAAQHEIDRHTTAVKIGRHLSEPLHAERPAYNNGSQPVFLSPQFLFLFHIYFNCSMGSFPRGYLAEVLHRGHTERPLLLRKLGAPTTGFMLFTCRRPTAQQYGGARLLFTRQENPRRHNKTTTTTTQRTAPHNSCKVYVQNTHCI